MKKDVNILGISAFYHDSAACLIRNGKIIAADVLGLEKIPAALSLGVTVVLIAGGIVYSLWRSRAAAPAVR